jgi:hypothetical protein
VLELADAQQRDAANHASGGSVREMAADERADLIAQLKAKWTEVSQRYSLFAHRKISTTNSSVGEIRLKENCESLMDKLEKERKEAAAAEAEAEAQSQVAGGAPGQVGTSSAMDQLGGLGMDEPSMASSGQRTRSNGRRRF